MVLAIVWTGFGSMYAVWSNAHWYGVALVAAFISLAVVVHLVRSDKNRQSAERTIE